MASRGAACRPSLSAASAVAVDAVAAVPVFGVPAAVFVPASVVAARASVRAAGAVAVVSAPLAAFWHLRHFSVEPVAAGAVAAVSDRSVAGVAGQRFSEALSAAPESAAARLADAAVAGFVQLSVFWHPQHFSAEALAAPGLVSARPSDAPDPAFGGAAR